MPSIFGHRNGGLPILTVSIRYHALNGLAHSSGGSPTVVGQALVDTGATNVVVTPALIEPLELRFAANIVHTTVGGPDRVVSGYACDILFGSPPEATFTVTDVLAVTDQLTGFDLIIGWDVLRFFDLDFDRSEGFSLSW